MSLLILGVSSDLPARNRQAAAITHLVKRGLGGGVKIPLFGTFSAGGEGKGGSQHSNITAHGYPITKHSVYYSSSLSRDLLGYVRLVINTTLGYGITACGEIGTLWSHNTTALCSRRVANN